MPAEPSQVNFTPSSYNARQYEAGNLAALEEQGDGAPLSVSSVPRASGYAQHMQTHGYDPTVLTPGHPQLRTSQRPLAYPAQVPHLVPAPHQAAPGLPLSFWVITATLVAVGAMIGAYLAGVFS
jgi:hypothetical protein